MIEPEHIVHRDALGDYDHQIQPRGDGFQHRIGGGEYRHIDDGSVAAGRLLCLQHRVKHGHSLYQLALLAGGDACHHLGAVVQHLAGMKRTIAPGYALHDELGLLVNKYSHCESPYSRFVECNFSMFWQCMTLQLFNAIFYWSSKKYLTSRFGYDRFS